MAHIPHDKPLVTGEGELIPIAYRAGVVTVALGMLASLVLLWGVPDKWKRKPEL